jgi:hypothetical protein
MTAAASFSPLGTAEQRRFIADWKRFSIYGKSDIAE